MPDDDRLIERLEALGSSQPNPLTSERLAAIEATAMSAIATAESPPVGSPRRRAAVPVLLAVAALLIIFVVAAAWFAGGSDLTVQAYDGAVVIELPDGRTLDAEVGLDVPDGSFVEVGPDGSLRLGDDELGPGRYLINNGRAIPSSSAIGTTTTTLPPAAEVSDRPTVSPSMLPPAGDDGDGIDDGDGTDDDDGDAPSSPSTSIVPVRPTTTVPADRPPSRTTIGDRPTTTAPVRPTTTTTTTIVVDSTRPTTTRPIDRPPRTTTTTTTTTSSTGTSLPRDRGLGGTDG
jgi:hypothetical protein